MPAGGYAVTHVRDGLDELGSRSGSAAIASTNVDEFPAKGSRFEIEAIEDSRQLQASHPQ